MKCSILITAFFVSVGFLLQGCSAQRDDWVLETSPDIRAKLVYFFNKGTDKEKVQDFLRTVIAKPALDGTSSELLPGISSVSRVVIGDYEGGEINFKPNATNEQKAFVEKRVLESPFIYRIYKDVSPDKITDLEPNGTEQNPVFAEPFPANTKTSGSTGRPR
jgi:hypothetical protein